MLMIARDLNAIQNYCIADYKTREKNDPFEKYNANKQEQYSMAVFLQASILINYSQKKHTNTNCVRSSRSQVHAKKMYVS